MTGSNRAGMVIQERDRHLLRELSVMRVIDREQAATVGRFGSTTRVNARLLKLTRAGLLRRFFLGTTAGGTKALYALSEKGACFIGVSQSGPQRRADEALIADFFVLHQLATNDVYCVVKYGNAPEAASFQVWRSFPKRRESGLHLIPDGYFELATPEGITAAFLEVDLGHERLKVWQEKVRNYLDLAVSGQFEHEFGKKRFRVAVVADSERRMHSLRTSTLAQTDKIFWFARPDTVRSKGLFAPVWWRPKGGEQQPFVPSIK